MSECDAFKLIEEFIKKSSSSSIESTSADLVAYYDESHYHRNVGVGVGVEGGDSGVSLDRRKTNQRNDGHGHGGGTISSDGASYLLIESSSSSSPPPPPSLAPISTSSKRQNDKTSQQDTNSESFKSMNRFDAFNSNSNVALETSNRLETTMTTNTAGTTTTTTTSPLSQLDQLFINLQLAKNINENENELFLTPPISINGNISDLVGVGADCDGGGGGAQSNELSHLIDKESTLNQPMTTAVADLPTDFQQKPKRPYSYYVATNFHPLDLTSLMNNNMSTNEETLNDHQTFADIIASQQQPAAPSSGVTTATPILGLRKEKITRRKSKKSSTQITTTTTTTNDECADRVKLQQTKESKRLSMSLGDIKITSGVGASSSGGAQTRNNKKTSTETLASSSSSSAAKQANALKIKAKRFSSQNSIDQRDQTKYNLYSYETDEYESASAVASGAATTSSLRKPSSASSTIPRKFFNNRKKQNQPHNAQHQQQQPSHYRSTSRLNKFLRALFRLDANDSADEQHGSLNHPNDLSREDEEVQNPHHLYNGEHVDKSATVPTQTVIGTPSPANGHFKFSRLFSFRGSSSNVSTKHHQHQQQQQQQQQRNVAKVNATRISTLTTGTSMTNSTVDTTSSNGTHNLIVMDEQPSKVLPQIQLSTTTPSSSPLALQQAPAPLRPIDTCELLETTTKKRSTTQSPNRHQGKSNSATSSTTNYSSSSPVSSSSAAPSSSSSSSKKYDLVAAAHAADTAAYDNDNEDDQTNEKRKFYSEIAERLRKIVNERLAAAATAATTTTWSSPLNEHRSESTSARGSTSESGYIISGLDSVINDGLNNNRSSQHKIVSSSSPARSSSSSNASSSSASPSTNNQKDTKASMSSIDLFDIPYIDEDLDSNYDFSEHNSSKEMDRSSKEMYTTLSKKSHPSGVATANTVAATTTKIAADCLTKNLVNNLTKQVELQRANNCTGYDYEFSDHVVKDLVDNATYNKLDEIVVEHLNNKYNLKWHRIAALFELTSRAVQMAKQQSQPLSRPQQPQQQKQQRTSDQDSIKLLTLKLKEIAANYIHDKYCDWIIENGGWKSVPDSISMPPNGENNERIH